MLKTNTVMTAACVVLLGILGWLGSNIWSDVAAIKSLSITTTAQLQSINSELQDHENRIRQAERDVTILQSQHRDERRALSPKLDIKP